MTVTVFETLLTLLIGAAAGLLIAWAIPPLVAYFRLHHPMANRWLMIKYHWAHRACPRIVTVTEPLAREPYRVLAGDLRASWLEAYRSCKDQPHYREVHTAP